jgi:hypothetical protein
MPANPDGRFVPYLVPRGSLFIPPTNPTRHGEMENIKAYVKYSEIAGRVPAEDEFVERLRDVGLRTLMQCLSRL